MTKEEAVYNTLKEFTTKAAGDETWKAVPPEVRARVLQRLKERIEARFPEQPREGLIGALETGFGIGRVDPATGEFKSGVGPALQTAVEAPGILWNAPGGYARATGAMAAGAGKAALKTIPGALAIPLIQKAWKTGKPLTPSDIASALAGGTSLFGGEQFAESGRHVGAREYPEAVGSFIAGALQALPWVINKVPQGLTRHMRKVTLSAGEEFPVTPGTLSPSGALSKFEAVVGELPGGSRLRTVRLLQKRIAKSIINETFENVAQRAGATITRSAEPAETITAAASAIRNQVAKPLYNEIDLAMVQPGASAPVADALSEWAQRELSNTSVSDLLVRNTEIAGPIRNNLVRLATTPLANPAVVAASGGSAFKAYQMARSTLLDLGRTLEERVIAGKGSKADLALTRQMVKRVDDDIEAALRETNPDLVDKFRRANAFTKQSYRMEDIGRAVATATKGTEEAVQAEVVGGGIRPVEISGTQLVRQFRKMKPRGVLGVAVGLNLPAAKTLMQVAEYLDRVQQAGGLPAKLHIAGLPRSIGISLAAPITVGVLGHSVPYGMAMFAAELFGTTAVAWALTNKIGVQLLLDYLRAQRGSLREAALAYRLNRMAFEEETKSKQQVPR
jgi:hypothetical protein